MKHVLLVSLSFAAIAWPHFPPPHRDALRAIVMARKTASRSLPAPPPPVPDAAYP
jgi:hypothetical protein